MLLFAHFQIFKFTRLTVVYSKFKRIKFIEVLSNFIFPFEVCTTKLSNFTVQDKIKGKTSQRSTSPVTWIVYKTVIWLYFCYSERTSNSRFHQMKIEQSFLCVIIRQKPCSPLQFFRKSVTSDSWGTARHFAMLIRVMSV